MFLLLYKSLLYNHLILCCYLVAKLWLTRFATSWTIATPSRLFCPLDFPGKTYWSRFPSHSLNDLPGPQVKSTTPALGGGFFTTGPPRKPYLIFVLNNYYYFPYIVVEPELQINKITFLRCQTSTLSSFYY